MCCHTFLQAEHASRLVARGVGVISREAPAYRKADKDPPHFTAESIKTLVQEVRLGCCLRAAVVVRLSLVCGWTPARTGP